MSKEKEKTALESLKEIYQKNRKEKSEEAKKRFFGFLPISKSRGPRKKKEKKKKRKKVNHIDKYESTSSEKRSIVKDKVKFEKYKILKNY